MEIFCSETSHGISIALVGAGRGGLLISIARAIKNVLRINSQILVKNIIIVEKNPNCEYSLKYLIDSHPDISSLEQTKMTLLFGDCRKVKLEEHGFVESFKMDLIVSEMIGSFGCNELAPDTIGNLQNLASKKTIYIPDCCKSFIEPIGS